MNTENSGCKPYLSDKSIENLQSRLSKIEGQVRGISKMLQEKRNCNEILVQISAIKSAINQVAIGLLREHFKSCVKPEIDAGRQDIIDDLMLAVERLIKIT